MIPKVIHYCWFGRNPKPDLIKKCIESWTKYCPDYKIIEWNEDNFDINVIPYVKDAYLAKKWAFVSDFARLWIVYNYGGIYLDTDVLLHNCLDELLQYECFLASDDVRYINTGLGFGAVKGNRIIGKIMTAYSNYTFPFGTNVIRDTKVLERLVPTWKKSNKSQVVDKNILLIGLDDYGKWARHLYTYTWDEKDHIKECEEKISNNKKIDIMWKIKCKVRSPKFINYFDNKKGTKIEKVYTLLAYDFLDYGPVHYLKLIKKKIMKNKR